MSTTSNDTKPPLDKVIYRHTQNAALYHPSTKSIRLGRDREGREVYARATHRRKGICIIDFHYMDDDSRVYGLQPSFGIYPAFGRRDKPAEPLGPDTDGNIAHTHYINTYRQSVICNVDTKEIVAQIHFRPLEESSTGLWQPEGAIVEPADLVFVSKWDNPTTNPTREKVAEDYENGIITVSVNMNHIAARQNAGPVTGWAEART